jgi:anti-sigma B factor antagonist
MGGFRERVAVESIRLQWQECPLSPPRSFPSASPTPLHCEVVSTQDAARLVVIGEFDLAAAPIVDKRLKALRDAGFRRLVLDLRRVTFMDASGLRLILAWSALVQVDGLVAFQVIPGPRAVQRVFALTATAGRITFVDGDDAASAAADGTGDGVVARFDRRSRAARPALTRAAGR